MKKYISFSVLLCICIGIVGVLLWQFRGFALGDDTPDGSSADDVAAIATGGDITTPVETTPIPTTPTVTLPAPVPVPTMTLDLSGTYLSRHVTALTLRVEWAAYRGADDTDVYLSAEIYLDGSDLTLPAGKSGYVTVADQTVSFSAPAIALAEGGSVRLGTVAFRLESEERADTEIPLYVNFSLQSSHDGIRYESMELSGNLLITDRYGSLKTAVDLEAPSVDKTALPSGTAVLSLASLLQYHGLEADAVTLSDDYLDKMPAGFTSPDEANVGNPKNQFNSYECHAPVLARCAERYLNAESSSLTVRDATGINLSALLLSLTEDKPLVVWMPADAEAGPELSHTWVIEGETVYMNAIRCALLSGYDAEAGTVTLIYPGEEPIAMDMGVFYELFTRMGAQCIVLE